MNRKSRNRVLIASPTAYARSTSFGVVKYVKDLTFSLSSGQVLEDARHILLADVKTFAEDGKYDGYYAIVTSELDKSDENIVDIYRGLCKIEDSFRVTKRDLETRPVYVSRYDHIEAHFLICFVTLVLVRLLEKKLNGKYPVSKLLDSLRRSSCSLLEENMYLFDYHDPVLSDLGKNLGINFNRKYRTAGEIKKIFADFKKTGK